MRMNDHKVNTGVAYDRHDDLVSVSNFIDRKYHHKLIATRYWIPRKISPAGKKKLTKIPPSPRTEPVPL